VSYEEESEGNEGGLRKLCVNREVNIGLGAKVTRRREGFGDRRSKKKIARGSECIYRSVKRKTEEESPYMFGNNRKEKKSKEEELTTKGGLSFLGLRKVSGKGDFKGKKKGLR